MPHCQLTRAIIALPNIRGVVRVGRHPRQIGARALEVPKDRRVDRIFIRAVLGFKFPLGLHKLGACLAVFHTSVGDDRS